MAVSVSKVINVATKYDGYLEKKSNKDLDDKTANAGMNNYTRFGRDYDKIMGTKLNGQSWCAMFVSTVFVEAYGVKAAKKLLGGDLFAYTPSGATRMGAVANKTPKKGDIVFFYSTKMGRISHVGLVIDVKGGYVYTIEGNTSSDPGVVRNGGSVNRKKYKLPYASARYATPLYGSVNEDGAKAEVKEEKKPATSAKKPTATTTTKLPSNGNTYKAPKMDGSVVLKNGSSGQDVKWLQFELNQWKASLKIDGNFGKNTENWVRKYQTNMKLTVDGEAGKATLTKLLKDGM